MARHGEFCSLRCDSDTRKPNVHAVNHPHSAKQIIRVLRHEVGVFRIQTLISAFVARTRARKERRAEIARIEREKRAALETEIAVRALEEQVKVTA